MSGFLYFLIDFTFRLVDPAVSANEPTTLVLLARPVIIKVLTAFVACLMGLIVALVAGILTRRSQRLSVAVAAGGGAFAATVLLCLALFSYVLT